MFGLAKALRSQPMTVYRLTTFTAFFKSKRVPSPKIRGRTIQPVFPPPGLDLQVPEGWTVEKFFQKIGGGLPEYADKFEDLKAVFDMKTDELKEKGVPPQPRKHLRRYIEQLRRGVLTWEFLERRTTLTFPHLQKAKK
eukprot:TRINITY_DN4634_c0_g1_i1.p1 TRINITY_DN4634_c0_g1~~TRINITY_DN4634_c0_g1_i1.p1  ORF type:complete len:138 (+),score=32.94 TRINITY_DN4634_c0_g1_i1:93-506(+)